MPYRNKTYVAFDGDEDIHYYRLMLAWRQSDGFDFNFYDAHDLNSARDSSTEESIKSQLAERMRNTKLFILLLGEKTKRLRKFVSWEIEQAIKRDLPIIAVNLNGHRNIDRDRSPNSILDRLSIHISFQPAIIQYAMDNWPKRHSELQESGIDEPRYYKETVYYSLKLF